MKKEKIAIQFKSQGKETTVYKIHPNKTVAELLILILWDQHFHDKSYLAPDFYVNIPAYNFWNLKPKPSSLLSSFDSDLSKTLSESGITQETYLEGIRHTEIGHTPALRINACRRIYNIQPQLCHWLSRRRLLSYAVRINNLSMTQALIEMGALNDIPYVDEIVIQTKQDFDLHVLSALSLASYENNIDIVKTLIVHRAAVNQVDNPLNPIRLNPIGIASHSLKDTSQSVFILLAAGTKIRSNGDFPRFQVYQDSHLKIRELVSYGGILPEENKQDHVLNYSRREYKISRDRFSPDDDDREVTTSDDDVGCYLMKCWKTFPLEKNMWAIISAYYNDTDSLRQLGKKVFLEPIENYLAEKKSSSNKWLNDLKQIMLRDDFSFSPQFEDSISFARVICLHVEWEVSRTGKLLSKDFAALAKLAPAEWLRGAIRTGRQQYRNYNPLPKCLLFTTNTKKQRVVEFEEGKQITSGMG